MLLIRLSVMMPDSFADGNRLGGVEGIGEVAGCHSSVVGRGVTVVLSHGLTGVIPVIARTLVVVGIGPRAVEQLTFVWEYSLALGPSPAYCWPWRSGSRCRCRYREPRFAIDHRIGKDGADSPNASANADDMIVSFIALSPVN